LTHILYPPNVFVVINIIQKVQVCVYFFSNHRVHLIIQFISHIYKYK